MEGGFWGLEAMIGETMMTFSGSRTRRVSAIGIFLRSLPKMQKMKKYLCKASYKRF